MKERVVVAMSGGVDSSVAAALLKREGYEVIGVTMQIWEPSDNSNSCCGYEAAESARRAADKLEISHYVLNFREVFNKIVISDFCKEYSQGRTPNPCIRCNQYIKFDVLLQKARALDAGYIATGHYARIVYNQTKKRYLLKKGVDLKKDQSYVLYTMTQDQLKNTLFPLGGLTKEEVRKIAKELLLPTADRKESQEICFIPDRNYAEFLKKTIPAAFKEGPIKNSKGDVLGMHKGILSYTIGQREGLGIAYKEPLYVINIDSENNSITVGTREESYANELWVKDLNYVSIEQLTDFTEVRAKIRYLHPESEVVLEPSNGDGAHVNFKKPQFAITPGQAVVFYDGDIVVGGGTIYKK